MTTVAAKVVGALTATLAVVLYWRAVRVRYLRGERGSWFFSGNGYRFFVVFVLIAGFSVGAGLVLISASLLGG